MKTLCALLIAALVTTAACGKKEEAAKTDPAKGSAMAPTDPPKAEPPAAEAPKADPATPDPAAASPTTAAAAAAGGAMSIDEAGTKALAFLEKVNAAVTSAGGNCAKMGANLRALTAEAVALKAEAKAFERDPARKQAFEAKYGEKVRSQTGFAALLLKCADNADVNAFFSSME